MVKVIRSDEFAEWLDNLKDATARGLIVARLERAEMGLFGDIGDVGDGVKELRIHYGPGYRVYYVMIGDMLVVRGGDKGSQKRDIKIAKEAAQKLKKPTKKK